MKQKPFEKNSNSSHYNDWLKEPEMKYITKLTNKVNGKVRYLVSMGKSIVVVLLNIHLEKLK